MNLIKPVAAGLLVSCLLVHATVLGNDALAPAVKAFEARDYQGAMKALTELQKQREDRDILFHLARLQYRLGDFETAADTLTRLHAAYPLDADGYYLSGLVYLSLVGEVNVFRKVGMAKKALESWRASVAANPRHLDSRYAIFAYYASAPGIAGGDLVHAGELQRELKALDEAYGAMASGLLLSRQDQPIEAEAAYREAVQLMDRAGPYFSLAQFYMQTEQFAKAIDSIDQFNAGEKRWWDPDITVAHLIVARANAELGNVEAARTKATQALALNPNKQIKALLEETLDSL